MSSKAENIIISRVDNIGDVVLTLPVAGVLKEINPDCTVHFLGKAYTKPIIRLSQYIDVFLDWDEIRLMARNKQVEYFESIQADTIIHIFPNKEIARLAYKAKIPTRIGTSRRIFHFRNCNQKVSFSRRKSSLHEAQLNLKLLAPLGAKEEYSLFSIPKYYGLSGANKLPVAYRDLLAKDKFNLILHPKSKGSAREWGLENFATFLNLVLDDKFKVFITGTAEEGRMMKEMLSAYKGKLVDLTGKFTLPELIGFINAADGLIAASTGPLHIAAALGKHVIGLYAPMRPIFPGRWAPLGTHAEYLVADKECNKCRKSGNCECISSIRPDDVMQVLHTFVRKTKKV